MVLSGSLPPGVPDDWYADVVARLHDFDCRVAVDTSEGPLSALAAAFDRAAPDLIKPNSEELAGLSGRSAEELESAAHHGDPEPVVSAALDLVRRGVGGVLATLGAAGAVLVDGNGAWIATPPPITPRSTVGAGDSSLAGYLRADVGGADAAGPTADGGRLRQRRRVPARFGAPGARAIGPRRGARQPDFPESPLNHHSQPIPDESVSHD